MHISINGNFSGKLGLDSCLTVSSKQYQTNEITHWTYYVLYQLLTKDSLYPDVTMYNITFIRLRLFKFT